MSIKSKGLSQDPTRYRVRWTNNTIPYVLSSEYTTTNKNMLRDAMTKLENLVANPTTKAKCVRFVPKTASHKNWLSIESGTGCSSYVTISSSLLNGLQKWSNLSFWGWYVCICGLTKSIAHEERLSVYGNHSAWAYPCAGLYSWTE